MDTYLPWTRRPLIVNAPMAGFAGASLATAVSEAGGLGLIGSAFSMDELRTKLQQAKAHFSDSENRLLPSDSDMLPIGVGFLPFIAKLEDVVPLLREFKPVITWLFAAKEEADYAKWACKIREECPETKIWIQTGSVAAALDLAQNVQPDALVLQGSDAGGHGFQKSASIVSLVPEASDALRAAGFGHIPLIASGGVVDGRGVAAALTLGAQGVVMGTRFLAAEEVTIHPTYQAAVLEAADGGQVTVRSKLFDELPGPNIWPEAYDGRSIVVKSYLEWKGVKGQGEGKTIEEIRELHKAEREGDSKGYSTGGKGRAAIWAGAGVGLVKRIEKAGDIVERVRSDAKETIRNLTNIHEGA